VQLAAHSLADDVKVNKDYDGGDDISDWTLLQKIK
jgi:hypothetical protein